MRLYLSRPEQYVVALLLLAILGALVVAGYAYGARTQEAGLTAPPLLERPRDTAPPVTAAPAAHGVTVHVAGAVVRPGVYHLPPDARVTDALDAAGGATPEGVPEAHNLAARVEDGAKLTVPTRDEWRQQQPSQPTPLVVLDPLQPAAEAPPAGSGPASAAPPTPAPSAAAAPAESGPPSGKFSLNKATQAQLERLPGIGPAMARRILDYRAQHGPFKDLAELQNIPRIGPKTYEKILPYLTL